MKVVKNALKIKMQSFLKVQVFGRIFLCSGQYVCVCVCVCVCVYGGGLQLPGFILKHTVKPPDIC